MDRDCIFKQSCNPSRDEHFKRSPECAFFTLINDHKQSPAAKRTKAKRTSKASRLSTQSTFTVASDAPSLGDLPAEEEDSVLTTATNATITKGGKKMGKTKKGAAKGKKMRVKKDEAVEVEQPAPEPEDDDFEVKVDVAPKANRGRKRKSEHVNDTTSSAIEVEEAPPTKRRATRTRESVTVDDTVIGPTEGNDNSEPAPKPAGKRGRQSTKSTRKASAASAAPSRADLPNDDEIDQALQADLDRQLSDEENVPAATALPKKATQTSKITKADHAMFDTESMDVDEVAIEAELEAMEQNSKPLSKAKATKGKQPRKVSAKQQSAARKAAEAEAEAERLAEEEASQQIAAELERSIATHYSSPILQPKRQRASSRQPSQQIAGRGTRASVMSTGDNDVTLRDDHQVAADDKDDCGNESDDSMASQSTVVRGGSTRRGSTLKNGKTGKKTTSRNIEEIVYTAQQPKQDVTVPSAETQESIPAEGTSMAEDIFYTPALEAPQPVAEEPVPKFIKAKAVKSKGRPLKEAAAAPAREPLTRKNAIQATTARLKAKAKTASQPPRSPTPAPKETTPSQSPQSSDAENHPPSSKPSATTKKAPHTSPERVPLAATPVMSPSKRNIIAGLQTVHPWTAVDLDAIFLKSPSGENAISNGNGLLGDVLDKVKNGYLTSPEKKMSVEEWIHYNAEVAEEKLRGECERMVGTFEREGTRAMRALEGVDCAE